MKYFSLFQKYSFVGAAAFILSLSACSSLDVESVGPKLQTEYCKGHPGMCSTFVDARDSKTYSTVIVGSQVWMAENLNYGIQVSAPNKLGPNQKYCYDNLKYNCDIYGALYPWNVAVGLGDSTLCNFETCEDKLTGQVQGICPTGWHIPSVKDWNILENTLTSKKLDSISADALKSKMDWKRSGADSYGFSALPTGYFEYDSKSFVEQTQESYYLALTEADARHFSSRGILNDSLQVIHFQIPKAWATSVRCVKN
jgi:uncharacterized protein (TIGR02145 family)